MNAQGTEDVEAEKLKCNKVLETARADYIERIKTKLAALPRHSNKWWSLNRMLMRKKSNIESIPTLRIDGDWLTDATAKANAFAKTFVVKSILPPEVVDTPFFGPPEIQNRVFVVFRTRTMKRLLSKLNINKATANDQISAEILQKLSGLSCRTLHQSV